MEKTKTLKILLADDEPYILDIMAKKIKQAGYQVVTASDGEMLYTKLKVKTRTSFSWT